MDSRYQKSRIFNSTDLILIIDESAAQIALKKGGGKCLKVNLTNDLVPWL